MPKTTRPRPTPPSSAVTAESDALSAAYIRLSGVPDQQGRLPALAVLPLRLFLGGTFIYAGLQKLTDPQFFSPTAPGFIRRQMSGFVHSGSPLTPLLTHLAIPHAAPFGALIAFCELWVGLSALLGLLTRLGSLGGLATSLTFYLTATWSVHPYFLGADLPYAVGWLTLVLVGPGVYSLDASFVSALRRAQAVANGVPSSRRPAPTLTASAPVTRAVMLRMLGTVAAVVVGGGVLGGLTKLRTPNRVFSGATHALGGGAAASGATGLGAAPTAAAGAGTTAAPAGYTLLGKTTQVPVNSAGQYTDPISGDPALLIHLPDGHFVAYDAVFTHAGCTVQYDPTQRAIVCPCHGAAFDPAHGAQVIAGPAPQALAPLQVEVSPAGTIYAKTR